MLDELRTDDVPAHAEHARGLELVAPAESIGGREQCSLDATLQLRDAALEEASQRVFERIGLGRGGRQSLRWILERLCSARKVRGREFDAAPHQQRMLHRVLELAHVPGPPVAHDAERGTRAQTHVALTRLATVHTDECSVSGRMSPRRSRSGGSCSEVTFRR